MGVLSCFISSYFFDFAQRKAILKFPHAFPKLINSIYIYIYKEDIYKIKSSSAETGLCY